MQKTQNNNSDITALFALLKAHVTKKTHLLGQISQQKITQHYIQMNIDCKDARDISTKAKDMKRKLEKMKPLFNAIKLFKGNDIKQLPSPGLISNLSVFTDNGQKEFDFIDNLEEIEKKVVYSRKKYLSAQIAMKNLAEKFKKNAEILDKNEKISEVISLRAREIEILREKKKFLDLTNCELSGKVENCHKVKFGSRNIAKVFQQLPDSTLLLRSKILLKEELCAILTKTQEEFESFRRLLLREKSSLHEIEYYSSFPYSARNRSIDCGFKSLELLEIMKTVSEDQQDNIIRLSPMPKGRRTKQLSLGQKSEFLYSTNSFKFDDLATSKLKLIQKNEKLKNELSKTLGRLT